MAINKAENILDHRLEKEIAALKRQQREIRTIQPNSGDALITTASGETLNSFTLNHAEKQTILATVTPTSPQLMFAEVAFTIYIGTDNDKTYRWPDGSNLTSDQIFGTFSAWRLDLSEANDTTGKKTFMLWVLNTGANPYTYYVHSKFYVPGVAIA